MAKAKADKYFLPYQLEWLADTSRIKLWRKSRRIGATYVQSYEDVRDAAQKTVPAVWFSSADESAAKEYIEYCEIWVKLFDTAARSLGEQVIDSDKDIKALVIQLSNGVKIHALTSNPKAFRSKGGKVVLDEYSHHDDADAMWKAARPCITWGFPLRILSSQNGKSCKFYQFQRDIEKGILDWSMHTTDIYQAVADGLADKIMGRALSEEERQEWLDQEKNDCGDDETWAQEYGCKAIDEASAFLTYKLIHSVERNDILTDLDAVVGDLFVGFDVARRRDLAVIWALEASGAVRKVTRAVEVMEKFSFRDMRERLDRYLMHPNFRRACIDETGIGMQMAEEAAEDYGKFRVEGVYFTGRVKEELAFGLKSGLEDKDILIPNDKDIREDLHSVRKTTTASGNIRLAAERKGKGQQKTDGHADRFWALALANHAAGGLPTGPPKMASRSRRKTQKALEGY